MAKKSKIVKNQARQELVARHRERRTALREASRDMSLGEDERQAARRALSRLPRDSSPVRVRNRDAVDGRPRGYLRQFGLSRVRMRQMAHAGELPGVVKSSW